MKPACMVVAASLALLVTSIASAQTQPQQGFGVSFGIGGGLTHPIADALDILKDGFNGQGYVRLEFGPILAMRAEVNYQNFDLANPVTLSGTMRNGTETIVGGQGLLEVFVLTRRVRPYLLAGAGAANLKTELDGNDGPSTSTTNLTASGGAGVEFAFEGLHVYLEGRVDHVFTEDEPFGSDGFEVVPLSVGVVF